ncbi:hypothetical protein ABEB36_005090, partial [Hypothenemus hampei]
MAASSSSFSMQSHKSAVWLHFDCIEGTSKVKCKICRNLFSYKGSAISNLRKHLKIKHPILCRETLNLSTTLIDDTEDSNMDSQFSAISPTPSSSSISIELDSDSQISSTPNLSSVPASNLAKKQKTQSKLDFFRKIRTPVE